GLEPGKEVVPRVICDEELAHILGVDEAGLRPRLNLGRIRLLDDLEAQLMETERAVDGPAGLVIDDGVKRRRVAALDRGSQSGQPYVAPAPQGPRAPGGESGKPEKEAPSPPHAVLL